MYITAISPASTFTAGNYWNPVKASWRNMCYFTDYEGLFGGDAGETVFIEGDKAKKLVDLRRQKELAVKYIEKAIADLEDPIEFSLRVQPYLIWYTRLAEYLNLGGSWVQYTELDKIAYLKTVPSCLKQEVLEQFKIEET